MKITDYDWADASIIKIDIEYDRAVIASEEREGDRVFWRAKWICTGLLGMTDLCIWDDTTIDYAGLTTVTKETDAFVKSVFDAYGEDGGCFDRNLIGKTIFKLYVKLENGMTFNIYCLDVEVIVENN